MPSFLENETLRLVLVGGKGGSGKTTSACATAIHLAELDSKKRILIVSTDPAHSVGDSFECEIGNSITPVEGVDNLWALEIDAEEVNRDFSEKYNAVMKLIADRGTYFDKEDIENFFSLTLPGLDEVMAIIRIANILKEEKYDLIILDTAPTGHTIRLLSLPKEMEKWIRLMDIMQSKHRFMTKRFTGRYRSDDADQFIKMMRADVGRVKMLLSDDRTTEFVPVTIPEPMSIDETNRLLARLRQLNITSNSIIVNRIAQEQNGCGFCASRAMHQKDKLDEIEKSFSKYKLYKVPLFPYEIRGIKRLKEYGDVLFGRDYGYNAAPKRFRIAGKFSKTRSRLSELLKRDSKLIILGGKGGVGKTSIASATALRMAKVHSKKRILVFSTDPAHALSDCFGLDIGDRVTPIEGIGNLFGFEINAVKRLHDWQDSNKENIEAVFQKFLGSGMDIKFDREIMTELVSISPPGLDEIMALGEITDFLREEKFDLYVLDSAATGHLIRFLELPHLLREWQKAIFRLLLKYKGAIKLTKTAEEMVQSSRKVRMIQELLTDSKTTQFVAVTIPEEMALVETDRLLRSLKDLNILCRDVVINMIVPPTKCAFCDLRMKEQQKYVREVKANRFSDYCMSEVPQLPHKIKGMDDLAELSTALFGK